MNLGVNLTEDSISGPRTGLLFSLIFFLVGIYTSQAQVTSSMGRAKSFICGRENDNITK